MPSKLAGCRFVRRYFAPTIYALARRRPSPMGIGRVCTTFDINLSDWPVNKAKENPKTVPGILRHSRIQTTPDLYTDEDLDEMIAAQDKFIDAVGFERETVQ